MTRKAYLALIDLQDALGHTQEEQIKFVQI